MGQYDDKAIKICAVIAAPPKKEKRIQLCCSTVYDVGLDGVGDGVVGANRRLTGKTTPWRRLRAHSTWREHCVTS